MDRDEVFLLIGAFIGGILVFLFTMTVVSEYFVLNSNLGEHTCSKLGLGYKTTNIENSKEGNLEKYQIVCEKPTKPIIDGIVVGLV